METDFLDMVTLAEENNFNLEVDKLLHMKKQNHPRLELDEDDMPFLEVERKMINHIAPSFDGSFDKVRYFVYRGVKVYEKGYREQAQASDNQNIHDKVFPNEKR